ncbi:DUF5916 domain-containing protein [Gemmatimonadota bacterium]
MRRRFTAAVAGLPALLLLFSSVSAQTTNQLPFRPLKIETAPVIDGVLDDEVWQLAPSETGFMTYSPDYGVEMTDNTIVYYAYDRENLYFAYRCMDSRPDLIKTSVTARDRIRSDDWVCINLDTFNDNQSLFVFYTNPLGIQMDTRATATSEDPSADFIWYSAGQITDEGYTIEVQIPFKSIRFSYTEPVIMGVIFERYISRLSQAGTYPALDPRHGPNFLTQTRPLIYEDIKHYRLVELLPAVTYGASSTIDEGSLVSDDSESTLSLTGKVGLTSHLVLDGTINPDFSQVETDAGQVDINRRSPLFFQEKRSFFLEGREYFDFGGRSDGGFLGAVVHTRNIVDPSVGVKLTGKIGDRNTIATIYARDEYPETTGTGVAANSAIMRYKRSLSGDSFIGGFFTQLDQGDAFNRVLGVDGVLRLNPESRLSFHAFSSQDEDPATLLDASGRALGLDYTYYTRDWMVNVLLQDVTDQFNTATGYISRNGATRYQFGVLKMLYSESEFILRKDILVHSIHTRDHPSAMWERYNAIDGRLMFGRSSMVQAGYVMSNEIFRDFRFETQGLRVRANTQFTKRLFLNLSYRNGKKIRYLYSTNPYQGHGTDISGSVTYQFTDHFSSSLSATHSDFINDETSKTEIDYQIYRSRNTYQINKYLFVRAVFQYNTYYEELTTDLLASFTWIPGTVVHIGYGSLFNRLKWDGVLMDYVGADRFLEMQRGLFFKASYLWRM